MSRKGWSSRGAGNRAAVTSRVASLCTLNLDVLVSPELCYSTFHFHFAKSELSWRASLL